MVIVFCSGVMVGASIVAGAILIWLALSNYQVVKELRDPEKHKHR